MLSFIQAVVVGLAEVFQSIKGARRTMWNMGSIEVLESRQLLTSATANGELLVIGNPTIPTGVLAGTTQVTLVDMELSGATRHLNSIVFSTADGQQLWNLKLQADLLDTFGKPIGRRPQPDGVFETTLAYNATPNDGGVLFSIPRLPKTQQRIHLQVIGDVPTNAPGGDQIGLSRPSFVFDHHTYAYPLFLGADPTIMTVIDPTPPPAKDYLSLSLQGETTVQSSPLMTVGHLSVQTSVEPFLTAHSLYIGVCSDALGFDPNVVQELLLKPQGEGYGYSGAKDAIRIEGTNTVLYRFDVVIHDGETLDIATEMNPVLLPLYQGKQFGTFVVADDTGKVRIPGMSQPTSDYLSSFTTNGETNDIAFIDGGILSEMTTIV